MAQRVEHLVPQLDGARLNERVGHGDRRVVDGRVEHRLAELGLDRSLLLLGEVSADVLAQLVERVEAGGVGSQLVVELRQNSRAHLLDGDRELGWSAGEVVGAVVVGERHVDRALVARAGADELLLEAGDQAAAAQLDHLVVALAALEQLAVDRPLVVDDDEIVLLGSTLDRLESREVLAQVLELVRDTLLVDLRLPLADLEAGVVAKRRGRTHADLEGERQRLALRRIVAEVELRLSDRHDLCLAERIGVPRADRAANRLVEHVLAPDAADEDRRRDFALAEAGHTRVARESSRGLREALLDLGSGDLGVDADARFGQLCEGGLDGGGHRRRRTIPWRRALTTCGSRADRPAWILRSGRA